MAPNIPDQAVGAFVTGVFGIITIFLTRALNKQRKDIDTLSFLMEHFMTGTQRDHLLALERGEPLPYDKVAYEQFEREVRELATAALSSRTTLTSS